VIHRFLRGTADRSHGGVSQKNSLARNGKEPSAFPRIGQHGG